MRLPIMFLVAVALTACSSSKDDLLFASTSNRTLLEIGRESAGPINGQTAYSQETINRLMPGYTTSVVQTAVESSTVWTLAAFNEGIQIIQIHKGRGGKVGAVHGVTDHLKGPGGERIGMTFGQAKQKRGNCRVGKDLWRGMAICRSQTAKNVTLVFAVPNYEGPYDRLPDSGALKTATLQRIIWTPT